MKKLILIVCAVMSAMTMNAQSGFGLMGGANLSAPSGDGAQWRMGGFIGGMYNYQMNDWFSLQPSLLLSYQENQRDWKDKLTSNGFGNKEFYSQWAISLPILASFRVMKADNMGLRLNVGPYFQYALGGKEIKPSYAYVLPGTPDTGIPHGMSPKRSWDYSSDDKFTMGAQIGAQFDYKKMFFTFDYKHSFIRSQLNCNGFENTFQLGVGYKF
ncbi:MAG: porin family protein [Prevotella sp.]|nr:porin family protein [Prevotella sp.]